MNNIKTAILSLFGYTADERVLILLLLNKTMKTVTANERVKSSWLGHLKYKRSIDSPFI